MGSRRSLPRLKMTRLRLKSLGVKCHAHIEGVVIVIMIKLFFVVDGHE